MLHLVGDLKEDIKGLLQGINLDKVTNLNGAIERAVRTVSQKADIPEASGVQAITLYNGVYYYNAPDTIFGGAVNLIRRQGDASTPWDYNYKVPIDTFTRTKHYLPNGYMLDLEFAKGVGVIGIASPIPPQRVIINPMNSTTGIVASGSASGLTTDTSIYYESPASLRFTLTGSSIGIITDSLQSPLDLTIYKSVGVMFLAIWTPSATDFTTADIRLGSNASNYYEVSNTTGFLGAWQANEWTLVALDLAQATTVGSPVITAVDYVQIRLTHTATLVNFRLGGLWISLPSANEILFQSSAVFSHLGTLSQRITNDSDTIILNDAAYALLEHESALTVAFQVGGTLASGVIQTLNEALHGVRARNGAMIQPGLYDMYTADNPSAQLRQIGSYYDVNDGLL